MKKVIFGLALATSALFFMTSCTKKDDDKNTPTPEPVEEISLLIEWNVDSMKLKLSTMNITVLDSNGYYQNGEFTLNFINDSMVVTNMDGSADTSNYTIDNNKIVIEDMAAFSYELTSTKLVMNADEDMVDETTNMTYNLKMNIFATKK